MRRQLISLTPEGEKYHEELMDTITATIAEMAESYGLGEADLREYCFHLSGMIDILDGHLG
jgi:DNA-binding MarR family transcriptional regulator